ncbi:class II D-tagatose-bisphosphate aldolase non-catalytic subunit [Saliphagus sp. LR7]|uniref:class II D-tagatose-bisphosphate aldolase non-catalytic subunit n=1 Tax=Saliphagus sp. LR7 TaxID=2282654 RepID=UPI000DF792F9|nr:class II D-tagatose-bisphosphate aldolase, non-catalytic subunit [Saliphagus sp. LR7]
MTFDTKRWLDDRRGEATLLGVCPMSEEIVEATIREATTAADFVPMFIATPRQVDANRGYTGWSQEELIKFIDETADTVGYNGPTVVARDHGGPYQSTRDRGDPDVPLEDALEYATELFIADLESGFDVLHVDATEDARAAEVLDLKEVVRRTVELINRVERYRESEGLDPVYYEVGTEEITGGMTEADDFERYIDLLWEALAEAGRETVRDRLLFVVGQIGTTMRIDMENDFNPEKARSLQSIVVDRELFLKVHYTDWLDDDQLSQFPEIGIGAANVGPEFAASIIDGLEELEDMEREVIDDESSRSRFMESFMAAAVRDSPWQKFAPAELSEDELKAFAAENRRNIAYCVGRYVLNDPEVREARETLYGNVEAHVPGTDPHDHVVGTVRESIQRYVDAFEMDA